MGRPLKRHERVKLEAKAWELAVAGETQSQIAAKLKVDQGTVSRALSRVRARAVGLDDGAVAEIVALMGQIRGIISEAGSPEVLGAALLGIDRLIEFMSLVGRDRPVGSEQLMREMGDAENALNPAPLPPCPDPTVDALSAPR